MMHLHFLGIGGTAMGSVAVACKQLGYYVTGSDHAVYEPMLTLLAQHEIQWTEYGDGSSLILNPPDVTIVGNAISRGNAELESILDARLPITSLSAFVGEHLIARNTSIVCAGTHGKTTTSSLCAWILDQSGHKTGFMIGSVPNGFTNGCRPVPPEVHNTRAGVFVVEGDEYDTAFFDKRSKFVHYRPTVVILNNLEFDHADIFDDLASIQRAFTHLVRIVPRSGLILANADDSNVTAVAANTHTPVVTVGFSEHADWRITIQQITPQGTEWYLNGSDQLGPFFLPMPGEHNVRNASMAILATRFTGVTSAEAERALHSFTPPKRRLEPIGVYKGCVVIDDFAHHPTAIQATIRAARQKFPHGAIHAVFEPRSNTTTRAVFQRELSLCFTGATSVLIGPTHRPERFDASDRLDTVRLVADLQQQGIAAHAIATDRSHNDMWGREAIAWLDSQLHATDIILLLSNGNVGHIRQLLTKP